MCERLDTATQINFGIILFDIFSSFSRKCQSFLLEGVLWLYVVSREDDMMVIVCNCKVTRTHYWF